MPGLRVAPNSSYMRTSARSVSGVMTNPRSMPTRRASAAMASRSRRVSVQASAATFLERWSGYAGESADIAEGFSGALKATLNDYTTAEDANDRQFSDIDGRLGPAR